MVTYDGVKLADLPVGSIIGTSSRRRAAQLLHRRPDLEIADIRGNVETRLRKVKTDDANYDATMLAYAGLDRLGLLVEASEVLPFDLMLPAPGQGAPVMLSVWRLPPRRRRTRSIVSRWAAMGGAGHASCSQPACQQHHWHAVGSMLSAALPRGAGSDIGI